MFHIVDNVIENGSGVHIGARESFSLLLGYVIENKKLLGLEAVYVMPCDQDDIWVEEKIAVTMQRMQAMEAEDSNLPILVHSDLTVVSADNEEISSSYMSYQGLNAKRNTLGPLLLSNTVTGCTALLNEALVRQCIPVSPEAIMHDWWLALVASAFGRISYIESALVLYRQHGTNAVGAKEYIKTKLTPARVIRRVFNRKRNPMLYDVSKQALAFRQVYGEQLGFKQKCLLTMAQALASNNGLIQSCVYRLLKLA